MTDTTTLVELFADGIARGALFALLGTSITLVFGLGNVLNIATGGFALISLVVAAEVVPQTPNLGVAALAGVGFVAVLGLTVDRTLLSLVYREDGEDRILLGIFVTLGLMLFFEGVMFVRFAEGAALSHGVPAFTSGELRVRGSTILIIAVASVVILLLFLFLRRTYLGKATRTVFQDETGATLCGINPRRIRTLIFVVSVVLAGTAGILQGIQSPQQPADAFSLTVFAIIVSVVGGVRNIRGTVGAGLLLGLGITYANFFISAWQAQVTLFAVAIVVLLLRPEEVA
jgi:branched-chain amino acid transport system permease protein